MHREFNPQPEHPLSLALIENEGPPNKGRESHRNFALPAEN